MKKQLREELTAIAEKILQTKQMDSTSTVELKNLARQLYEKLTVLYFTENMLLSSNNNDEEEKAPEVADHSSSPEAIKEAENHLLEFPEEEHDEYAPDGTEYNDSDDGLTEPNTEKIKDIVAQMPPESQEMDDLLEYILPRKFEKNDMEDIGGVHYDRLPQFEPLHVRSQEPEKPRSLNDRLKKGIQIGINDRHAFVRHLFDGSNADYNRVLSQLNTLKTKEEAINFVLNMVKPDYNNWEGKEEYENRFLHIVENRFD